MTKSIAESFHDYFEMVPATTDALKETVYRLRYQVFCLETGFEQAEQFPDGLEKDEYDTRSKHYLIRHRTSGVYAATTRLILPDPDDIQQPFPIERHCRFDRSELRDTIPRNRLAEVSRFCVSKSFKRRPGEPGTIAGICPHRRHHHLVNDDERRAWPHITLALITCLNTISAHHGITHWYGLIEPSLFRLLTFLGIDFTAIGPLTEYRGKRRPCIMRVPEYLERVKKKNIQVWEMLTCDGTLWNETEDAARPRATASVPSIDGAVRPDGGRRTPDRYTRKSTPLSGQEAFEDVQG
jgi:N-acyl amino acid synthase of PEP-CTERM/exosortase system